MTLSKLLMIVLTLVLSCGAFSQVKTRTPEQIRNEMTEIEENTDWTDEEASARAQAKMEALSKELMMAGKAQQLQGQGIQADSAKLEEDAEYKMGLWKQMLAGVDQGESGEWDLAKSLRDEIVEAYLEDQSPKNINPEVLNSVTFLRIDMSLPTVQRTIDVMQNFKAIKTLIITGGVNGAPVDLEIILNKASNYPLKALYIINFRQFVNTIPQQINNFDQLETVGLFNNNLHQLPDLNGLTSSLDSLFIDINPLSTLFPKVNSLTNLKKLGIAKTSVSDAEIKQIQLLLPDCEILY